MMRATRLWMAACAVSLAAITAAAAQPAPAAKQETKQDAKPEAKSEAKSEAYVPYSGQAGKDVVWVPTPQRNVDRMLEIARVTPDDYLIDLGSGDGRTVITAAQRGIRALGVEYNADMVGVAQRAAEAAGVTDKAKFVQGDIFETDFSQATVLTLFLLPDLNVRLRPTILKMKPGTRVVSNTFTMGDWTPDETAEAGGDCTSYCKALKWVVPANVDGTWKLGGGELKLSQKYQMITGTLSSGGKDVPVEGRLNGTGITFTAGGTTYTGTVDGNSMSGKAEGGSTPAWTATKG